MKSLLSCKVIVPSKSVKKMNLGFSKGNFIALRSDMMAYDLGGNCLSSVEVVLFDICR